MNESGSVKSAVRVLDLLEALSRAEAPVGVSEISRSLAIPKSSAHMLLCTLEARGYVVGDPQRRFHLNPIFSAQGSWIGGAGAALMRIAREPMDELARATGESSFLGVGRDDASMEYIAKVVSTHELRCDGNLGEAKPMHSTSIGLTLLAFQDPERTERFLARGKFERLTQATLTDERELRKEIDRIRDRGYAVVCGSNSPGVSGVAAPILDSNGRAVAGINISAPAPRFEAMQRRFTAALLRAAQTLGRQLNSAPERPLPARKSS
jgi:DNA-binding IclR family transcriptional regulator